MKPYKIMFALFALLTVSAFAQEALPQVEGKLPVIEEQTVAVDFITNLAVQYPWLATLIIIMGTLRAVAKPLSSLIHTVITVTPSTWDDGIVSTVKNFFLVNPVGKGLAYGIDWLTSIKIKPPAK